MPRGRWWCECSFKSEADLWAENYEKDRCVQNGVITLLVFFGGFTKNCWKNANWGRYCGFTKEYPKVLLYEELLWNTNYYTTIKLIIIEKNHFKKSTMYNKKLQIYLNSTKIYSNNMSDRMTLFSHEKA